MKFVVQFQTIELQIPIISLEIVPKFTGLTRCANEIGRALQLDGYILQAGETLINLNIS